MNIRLSHHRLYKCNIIDTLRRMRKQITHRNPAVTILLELPFRADDADFLVSSDPHLRLTDVLEDADGSLLVIDMGAWYTYGFLGNVLPRPEMLGAIYRIRRTDAPPVADPRGNDSRGKAAGA